MKVLIVCSWRDWAENTQYMAPFVYEQMEAVRKEACVRGEVVEFETCFVRGGGIRSYIRAWKELKKHIHSFQPDIIHAHYGLCGVLANLQRKVPVITTYHGSDINTSNVRRISNFALRHSAWNIFVSRPLLEKALGVKKRDSRVKTLDKCSVVPCGVDTQLFHYIDKQEAREKLGWKKDGTYILFSKSFTDDPAKNYPLAQQAVDMIEGAKLVELYGYSREEVVLLLNASDLGLMTSFTEGSPQFVKEALACGCPIVSTDVGDVRDVVEGVENCFLTTYEPTDVAEKIRIVLTARGRAMNGVEKIQKGYSSEVIAHKILDIYHAIIK